MKIFLAPNILFFFSSIAFAVSAWSIAVAADPIPNETSWERFRGSNGLGVLAECQVQIPWKESQVTRVAFLGSGNGSPILAGGYAFLLSAEAVDATRHVVAIDIEKNSVAWTKSYPSKTHALHKFSSYASSTPCADNENVYVAWADPDNVVLKAFTKFLKCLEC